MKIIKGFEGENLEASDFSEWVGKDYIDYKFEYKNNQKLIKALFEENQKYKETIDKAIKYIKANEFYLDYSTGACIKGVMPLLNILKEVE